jgi:hypothetical protein
MSCYIYYIHIICEYIIYIHITAPDKKFVRTHLKRNEAWWWSPAIPATAESINGRIAIYKNPLGFL